MSTTGPTPPSTVRICDSLRMALPLDTKKQIAAILQSPEEGIKLEYANVQVNIYVKTYAVILVRLANAMAICNGQSPESLNYDTKVMRKHFAGCLEDKSSIIFQLGREVLNRKQKDRKYSRFTAPAIS